MDKHTGGLVYHDQIAVFKDYFQRYLLRPHCRFPFRLQLYLNKVSAAYSLTFVLDPSVDLALAVLDHVAKVHPAEAVKPPEKKFFEPDPHDPVGNDDLKFLWHRSDFTRFDKGNEGRKCYVLVL
jgi:hypothetical protein